MTRLRAAADRIPAIVFVLAGILLSGSTSAQEPEISAAAKDFCDAHAALPENKPYEAQIATFCYQWAAKNEDIAASLEPEAVHGRFRHGSLICHNGYWRGYDQEGACEPWPEVANGTFGGNTLKCNEGYLLIVDRAVEPGEYLTVDEMACVAVSADRMNSLNKCPRGTVAVRAMSRDDRRRYPRGADCAK
jgi:hypothetical protein